MCSIKEICLIVIVITAYLHNCKNNADSAKFTETTGEYNHNVNNDERDMEKNYFSSDIFTNNITSETFIYGNKTEDDDDDYYYEYSDKVLYLSMVSNNCYLIMSPVFLLVGTIGNFLSITVLRR